MPVKRCRKLGELLEPCHLQIFIMENQGNNFEEGVEDNLYTLYIAHLRSKEGSFSEKTVKHRILPGYLS